MSEPGDSVVREGGQDARPENQTFLLMGETNFGVSWHVTGGRPFHICLR